MARKKYYNLKSILSKNADYNIIIGERSNGKTYACLKYCIEQYLNKGHKFVYIRRWKEDIIGKRGEMVFNAIVNNNEIKKMTGGEYTHAILKAGKYYLAYYDIELNKWVTANDYFCNLISLSDTEHDKSLSFAETKNIVFDEFLTRRFYLKDEFILFMNTLSTIIRDRNDLKIFMLGNTVNKYSPYFAELGINIDKLKQGTIDLYQYGTSELKLAIEYCDEGNKEAKESNKYFAFNNPRLQMITNGVWELDIYPHLPAGYKIKEKNIMFIFYILFDGKTIQGNVIQQDNNIFIFFHYKTTEIKNPDEHIIYSLENNVKINYRRNPINGSTRIESRINILFKMNKVFYQSNEVGEIVRNYLIQMTNTI